MNIQIKTFSRYEYMNINKINHHITVNWKQIVFAVTNSADPDQMAPQGAIWLGSTLLVTVSGNNMTRVNNESVS